MRSPFVLLVLAAFTALLTPSSASSRDTGPPQVTAVQHDDAGAFNLTTVVEVTVVAMPVTVVYFCAPAEGVVSVCSGDARACPRIRSPGENLYASLRPPWRR